MINKFMPTGRAIPGDVVRGVVAHRFYLLRNGLFESGLWIFMQQKVSALTRLSSTDKFRQHFIPPAASHGASLGNADLPATIENLLGHIDRLHSSCCANQMRMSIRSLVLEWCRNTREPAICTRKNSWNREEEGIRHVRSDFAAGRILPPNHLEVAGPVEIGSAN